MARIWMEGFEDGLPHGLYLEGNPSTQFVKGVTYNYPPGIVVASGRNTYSLKCIGMYHDGAYKITKQLTTALSEVYFRCWFKHDHGVSSVYNSDEQIYLTDGAGNNLIALFNYNNSSNSDFQIKARVGGSYSKICDVTISANTWHKLEFYFKVDSSTGAYEVRLNDASVCSASSQNTGSSNISSVVMGHTQSRMTSDYIYVDDIALNDTTGDNNNSWCGDGTIVGLKPKASGSSSEWTTSQGYALGENGTTTTNIEITGHGLATDDVIYNVTRNAYRVVTKVDDNNLTVDSVTSQAENDVFILFNYQATITAGSGTDTSHVVISGHTLESYDVFVNTSRSNAIRRAIYISGTSVYNSYSANTDYTGSTVGSQASGDNIKTFKVKQMAITDHYKAVYTTNPNPQYSNIQSGTSGQIDTFDMQELVADLAVPSNAGIIAVSLGIYAKEKGAGSKIKPVLRIDGTEYTGSEMTLGSGTLQYQTVYDENPDTSAPWDITEIDAIEAGVEVA
jgi:hypothetical protein